MYKSVNIIVEDNQSAYYERHIFSLALGENHVYRHLILIMERMGFTEAEMPLELINQAEYQKNGWSIVVLFMETKFNKFTNNQTI